MPGQMNLSKASKRLGSVLLFEAMGTSILIACANIVQNDDIAPIAMAYFVAVILTVKITGAQLNPALTWAIYIQDGRYRKHIQTVILIIVSQLVGAFLGL